MREYYSRTPPLSNTQRGVREYYSWGAVLILLLLLLVLLLVLVPPSRGDEEAPRRQTSRLEV